MHVLSCSCFFYCYPPYNKSFFFGCCTYYNILVECFFFSCHPYNNNFFVSFFLLWLLSIWQRPQQPLPQWSLWKQQPEQAGFQTGEIYVYATCIITGFGARNQARNDNWLETGRFAFIKTWSIKFESMIIPILPIIQNGITIYIIYDVIVQHDVILFIHCELYLKMCFPFLILVECLVVIIIFITLIIPYFILHHWFILPSKYSRGTVLVGRRTITLPIITQENNLSRIQMGSRRITGIGRLGNIIINLGGLGIL